MFLALFSLSDHALFQCMAKYDMAIKDVVVKGMAMSDMAAKDVVIQSMAMYGGDEVEIEILSPAINSNLVDVA